MDPLTHTFTGACLSASGLRRATPLATPTLILAANAPDVDIVAQLWDPWTALEWRRGITHGIPALLVLPILVTGAVLAWDRWVRGRKRREAPAAREGPEAGSGPARPGALLGLATIGVWTHPVLDWLNNYGMRWLLPFDGHWTYGDAVFILDPWLWLLLGGPLFLLHSRGPTSFALWGLLATLLSVPVLLSGMVPVAARGLWCLGLVAWILARLRGAPGPGSLVGRRVAGAAFAAAALYITAMALQNGPQRRAALAAAHEAGIAGVEEVMVAPVPANPFRGDVVLVTPGQYLAGDLHWLRRPPVRLRDGSLPRPDPADPRIARSMEDPRVRSYLVWSRFPVFLVEEDGSAWTVRVRDARYLSRGDGALAGPTLRVPRAAPD